MNSVLLQHRDRPSYVTSPFLPPIEEYTALLQSVWEHQWLTNQGPLSSRLEEELANYCGLPAIHLVANGTLALQLVYRACGLGGEVITTPFSFITTSSSLLWEGCKPRFADIDPDTFNLDPAATREAISPRTRAIVATHVFGNACDIPALEAIARAAGIPLIFDAAHAFGSRYDGHSLFLFGDAATASLHATKLFHSVEGGFVTTADPERMASLEILRRFGQSDHDYFRQVGINAKMSEFHAAMGLVNLRYADRLLQSRRRQARLYREVLQTDSALRFQKVQPGCDCNDAYVPVVLPSEDAVERVMTGLREANIHPRRYYYPALSSLSHLGLRGNCPVAEDISRRILCLPVAEAFTDSLIRAIAEETSEILSACSTSL